MDKPQALSPFTERLEKEMVAKGVPDRAALARLVDIPYHRLNPWWARPKAKPNANDLLALGKFFNVSGDYLLHGGERRPHDRVGEVMQRAKMLDDDFQEELESFVDYLLEKQSRASSESGR